MQPQTSATGLFLIGISHRTAPIALRERLALAGGPSAVLARAFRDLPGLREFVVLSTCNRLEVCGVSSDPGAEAGAARALAEASGAPDFMRHCYHRVGGEVIEHLLEVAIGLNSPLVGEMEIFGQMKKAYADAHAAGTTGPVTNRLYQKVFHGAKKVRTDTAISVGQVSIANVAVGLAEAVLGDLGKARVAVLGAGVIGEKTARAFVGRGAAGVVLASRNAEKAALVAAGVGASPAALSEIQSLVEHADIVVGATSSPDYIVDAEAVRRAVAARGGRHILLIDLSNPRNIDPACAGVPGAVLHDLDAVSRISEKNRASRSREIEKCREMIPGHVASIARSVWGAEPRAAVEDRILVASFA